ncbi:MAG TPA: prolyl oligopeptidase family serine peptidase [Anaerolineales bacterium]|nr:prolyl oligopeptidase family serine peptidase [Anaerolineales bacterium]
MRRYIVTMRIISLTLILLCLLTACTSPTAIPTPIPSPTTTPPPLTGEWIGTAAKPDGSIASVIVNFDEDIPELNIEPMTRRWKLELKQEGGQLRFLAEGRTRDPFERIEFSGRAENGLISGEITWDGHTSQTHFIQLAAVTDEILASYEGVYRFDSGRTLSIIVSPEFSSSGLEYFGKSLMMTDFENGNLRSLYAVDDSTFLVGVLRVVGAPFDGRIEFMKDGQGNIEGLMWWQTPNDILSSPVPSEFAARVPFVMDDGVSYFSADGTKLVGRLTMPSSAGPHAAFVMPHGSEAGTRDNFGAKLTAHYFLSRGIATLNYDKRGVGDSEGIYHESADSTNLKNLAADANAGVEYLLTRSEIDAQRIGLIGGSQAGWLIPIAASESEHVSFFVILSGPVASTLQEDIFSAYTDDGESSTSYDDAEITRKLRSLGFGGFNPIPYLAELTQPGLWLWGSVDKSVPVTFSRENLQVLIDGGKNNFEYQVLAGGDHGLSITPNGLFSEMPYSPGLALYGPLTEWLEKNNISAKE